MATEPNITVIAHGVDDLRLEEKPVPVIEKNEVLLRMLHVGICGTDLSTVKKGKGGRKPLDFPMYIGHEASGKVVSCGSDVKNLKPGDIVAVEPGVPCRFCDNCKLGDYNRCPSILAIIWKQPRGMLAKYFKHPSDFCFKLPDHVSSEEGAMMEPLAISVHACRRTKISLGSKVLVCGGGSIGVLCFLAAKAMGATNICVTDIRDVKLKNCKAYGADSTLNVKDMKDPKEIAKKIEELMGGMPDVTFECTGVESAFQTALYATKVGGKVAIVGMGAYSMNLPILEASYKELDIVGVLCSPNCFEATLDMVKTGKINLKQLITHKFPLENVQDAFDTLATDETATKVMVCI